MQIASAKFRPCWNWVLPPFAAGVCQPPLCNGILNAWQVPNPKRWGKATQIGFSIGSSPKALSQTTFLHHTLYVFRQPSWRCYCPKCMYSVYTNCDFCPEAQGDPLHIHVASLHLTLSPITTKLSRSLVLGQSKTNGIWKNTDNIT